MEDSKRYDVVVLTDKRYLFAKANDAYSANVVLEDKLVVDALVAAGLNAIRLAWDDATFDWSTTKIALFRTTWDYFDRFDEFKIWFDKTANLTQFVNSKLLIEWNLDKKYLLELAQNGIAIPASVYIEKGTQQSLGQVIAETKWNTFILKPVVSGAGRHTYKIERHQIADFEAIYEELHRNESLMLQEFQVNIATRGEVSLIILNGKFTHAVLKQAKSGDFRVQDDFGGSVIPYVATEEEIEFALKALNACKFQALYARVDIMWDNAGQLCLGELEMIEPELWFRLNPTAANELAMGIKNNIK